MDKRSVWSVIWSAEIGTSASDFMDVLGLVPDAYRGWDLRFDNNEDMPFWPPFLWVPIENTAEDEITWQYLR